MTIRSTCGPRMQPDRRLVAARLMTESTRPNAGERARSARPARRSRRAGRGRRSTPCGGGTSRPARSSGRRASPTSASMSAVDRAPRPGRSSIRSKRSSSLAMPSRMSASVRADRPAERPQAPGLGRRAEVVERLDAELRVELADGLRAEPGDPQQLDEARRDLRAEPVVVGHPAGRGELGDLVADRLADARDLRRRRRRGRPTTRSTGLRPIASAARW